MGQEPPGKDLWAECWGHTSTGHDFCFQGAHCPSPDLHTSRGQELTTSWPAVLLPDLDWSDFGEIILLGSFTPSDPQLFPGRVRCPQPRYAHPQEVGGQAPSYPVHDVEEKEAADGVEEPTWERNRAHPGPPSLPPPPPLIPLPSSLPLPCPALFCFPALTPLPRTGGAGHHGGDCREHRQSDSEDKHKAQRHQPDLRARGRGVSGRDQLGPQTQPQPPSPGPGGKTPEAWPRCVPDPL